MGGLSEATNQRTRFVLLTNHVDLIVRNTKLRIVADNLCLAALYRSVDFDLFMRMTTNVLFAVIVLAVGLWLCWRGGQFLYSLRFPQTEIVLIPFEGTDDAKKLSTDLWAKLRELQNRSIPAPTAYGQFALPSFALPTLAADSPLSTTRDVLEKLDLKIHDVKAGPVIEALNSLLAPVRYELRGSVAESSNEFIIKSQLVRAENIIASWRVSGAKPDGTSGDVSKKASAALDDLFDKLLYRMIFDFAGSSQPELKTWRTSEQAYHFKDWQSLRDFVRGLRSLRAYQADLNHADLKEAVTYLSDLATRAPNDPYALYFLGLALAGDRQDVEAVSAFRQLQRVLKQEVDQQKWHEILRESKFNEAIVTLKLHTKDSVDRAVKALGELIKELNEQDKFSASMTAEEQVTRLLEKAKRENTETSELEGKVKVAKAKVQGNTEVLKLLVLSYAQLAYSHGKSLTFLGSQGDATAENKEIDQNLELAGSTFDKVKTWERKQTVPLPEREKWDTANHVLEMRIENARGYCKYQNAVRLAGQDENFRESCNSAIEALEKANGAWPNYYAVLQNLGTIYADERFDPGGEFLEPALKLFEQTKNFVPNDYYGYQMLAVIHRRRAQMLTVPELAREEVQKGRNEACDALKRRPQTQIALIELARLARISWETSGKPEQEATSAQKCFQDAATGFNDQRGFLNEYLCFVKDLAEANYPSDKLDKELIELTNSAGLNQESRARLIELKLHLARASWEASGKKNDLKAKSVLEAFRDARTILQNQPAFDDGYLSLIEDIAQARVTDAAGLNELVERLVELANSPGREKRRAALVELANRCLQKTVVLTDNKPECLEARKKAEELQQEVNKLQ